MATTTSVTTSVTIEQLRHKAYKLAIQYSHLPLRDIRRAYFEIIASNITVTHTTRLINEAYRNENPEGYKAFFKGDATIIDNYNHFFIQGTAENIIETFLFQTELLLRTYYAKVTNGKPSDEGNINKIIATLFQDVQNNWTKEECNILVLFWTLRNTIHTGGIYFKKDEHSLTYKGKEYKFEYGKAPEFIKDDFDFSMVSDSLDAMDHLLKSQLIENQGSFDHPNYHALGK